jgi:hypothetical protein
VMHVRDLAIGGTRSRASVFMARAACLTWRAPPIETCVGLAVVSHADADPKPCAGGVAPRLTALHCMPCLLIHPCTSFLQPTRRCGRGLTAEPSGARPIHRSGTHACGRAAQASRQGEQPRRDAACGCVSVCGRGTVWLIRSILTGHWFGRWVRTRLIKTRAAANKASYLYTCSLTLFVAGHA